MVMWVGSGRKQGRLDGGWAVLCGLGGGGEEERSGREMVGWLCERKGRQATIAAKSRRHNRPKKAISHYLIFILPDVPNSINFPIAQAFIPFPPFLVLHSNSGPNQLQRPAVRRAPRALQDRNERKLLAFANSEADCHAGQGTAI